jgi:hypothetical protein
MRIAISDRLLPAKLNLAIARFVGTWAMGDILESSFFFVFTPGMRENNIWRDVIKKIFGQTQPTVSLDRQKPHSEIEALQNL